MTPKPRPVPPANDCISIMAQAAYDGDARKVGMLARYMSVNHPGRVLTRGYATPLMAACMCPDPDASLATARVLLERGAKVNGRCPYDGRTALHEAVSAKRRELVSLLLAYGADLKAKDDNDASTPLHVAIYANYVEIVRALTDAGASVEAEDARGRSVKYLVGWYSPVDGEIQKIVERIWRIRREARELIKATKRRGRKAKAKPAACRGRRL